MPVTGPDLVLWLDAQELAGCGEAARNPAAGAAIETWADKSSYHHDVRQAAAAQRPSYVRDVLDSGRHAVHFRAAGKQFLSAGNPAALDLSTVTAFVVARAGSSGSDMWLFSKNAWGPPWTGYGIAVSHDGLHPWPHLGLATGAHGYFKFGGNVKSGFRVVEVCYDGTVAQGVLDDRPDSQQVVSGKIANNGQDLLIGTLGSQFLEGDIAEVLIYRRALSEQERQQTRRYLLDKYDLPMGYAQPGDSPLVSDWLFQAEGHPLVERIHSEIRWTRELAARLARNPRTPDLSRDLAELDALAASPATAPGQTLGRAAVRERYLAVRQLKRRIMLKNPLLDFQQLLCIDQPYPEGSEWKHQAIHRLGHRAVPGGRLLILEGFDPSSPARQVGPEKPGSYWRPDVSFDGQRALFCYKAHDEQSFHLYEIRLDGTDLRQLTRGDYDDIDPIYLPDGHILFTTTRGNTYVRCGPYIYSYILARCDADGGNIYLISQNSEPDFVPSLLGDGRVVYSRWEYTDKSVFRLQSLWTTNPDGTGTSAFWGNQSVWPDHPAEPRQIPGSRRVMFSACGHHDWFSGCIGIIDPRRGFNFPDGLTKVTWDLDWPEVGRPPVDPHESEDYHASGLYTSYKTPYPLSDEDFLVSARGEGDKFRLYLMDVYGNRDLVYEGRHNIWHAIPIQPRPAPPRLPNQVVWPGTGPERTPPELGTFYSADVYQGLPDLPRGSVKYLRIVQSDAKTYSTWFKTFRLSGPPVSIVYEESVKRILSTVPVESDGSVYCRVPAGQALHFQLLDEQHRCLQTMRSFTGVMPGEHRGCVGCHESHSTAPPVTAGLAFRRPPTELTPPPWGTQSISYERFAQPVLDRHCGKCHQGDGEARQDLDLTLRPGVSVFKEPYLTLVGSAGWQNPIPNRGQPGYGIAGAIAVETMDETKHDPRALATLRPQTTLSYTSRLVELAASGKHYDVRVDPPDLQAADGLGRRQLPVPGRGRASRPARPGVCGHRASAHPAASQNRAGRPTALTRCEQPKSLPTTQRFSSWGRLANVSRAGFCTQHHQPETEP
jgi:hypothetical protein